MVDHMETFMCSSLEPVLADGNLGFCSLLSALAFSEIQTAKHPLGHGSTERNNIFLPQNLSNIT